MITGIFPCISFLAALFLALVPHLAYAQIDGNTCGDGASSVIFLHDQLQDSASFAGVWSSVCADPNIRAVRYDRRGYGQSPASSEPYSDMADLTDILQGLQIEHVTIVSSGTGAALAIDFAIKNPDMVNGLVLSSPSLAGSAMARDAPAFALALASMKIPVLVLTGATDSAESITAAQAISGPLPDANTVVMLSAGHYIEIERPDAFAQYVLGFVAGLTP